MRPDIHAYLRKWTIGMNVILAGFSLGITYLLTKSWLPGYLSFYLILTSSAFVYPIKKFMSENLAAALLAAALFFTLFAIERRSRVSFLASGLLFGLLILTKGIYFYGLFLFIALAYLFSALQARSLIPPCFFRMLLTFVLGVTITVGPWMLRNCLTFGSPEVASRGGFMRTLRAFYDKATHDEYRAMFWYSTPLKRILPPSEEDLERGKRLDQNNPDGFYKSAGTYASEVRANYGVQEGEKLLTNEALSEIFHNTPKYLLVTIPLAFQGIFLERGFDVLGSQVVNDFYMGIILILPLFPLLLVALTTRNVSYGLVVLVPLFSIFFHAFFSDSLPRYNFPIVPLLWVALITVAFLVLRFAILVAVKLAKYGLSCIQRYPVSDPSLDMG
jgi:4-amino-4-deoxy-L-arabinose transferase-like glycosyltransferase